LCLQTENDDLTRPYKKHWWCNG